MYEWYVVIACIVYLVLYLLIAILHTRHSRMHQYRNKDDYYVVHDENGEIHLIWIKDLKDEGSKAQRQDRTHSKRD